MENQLENTDNNNQKTTSNVSNKKKSKIKDRRRKRENIILPEYLSLKARIIESIVEVGKSKEYFTYDDIFANVVNKVGLDLNNVKKLKTLYSYIARITLQLEDNGYVKGFNVGQRRVVWKLIRPPTQS